MKIKYTLRILFVWFCVYCIHCTHNNTEKNAFDQSVPGMSPKKFAPGLISSEKFSETGCVFTKDLRSFYFTRSGGDLDTPTIFYRTFKKDRWSEEFKAPFEGFGPHLLSNDHSMIISRYKKLSDTQRTIELVRLKNGTNGWHTPEVLFEGSRASISQNGNIYYIDRSDEEDRGVIVFREFKNGHYSEAKLVGGGVNTPYYEAHPCIAEDESFLIFDSNRPDGYGQGDLYISFRDKTGSWGDATNLGDAINTEAYEAYASISPDGKVLFYSSNTEGNFDLYWVDAGIVSNLQVSVSYPSLPLRDLSGVAEFAENEPFPFRFPLDEIIANESLVSAPFCASGKPPGSAREYHAAEDFQRPAGTPVYAMADGKISFSGPMGGYGWLIIIDHPQANLYSLYGHLSPSRWRIKSGTVEKGELIAYLGDPDENGGSTERPLRPHLHLGVRVGQKSDYPGFGEGRWMAGWIKPYPPDLGWMQPSAIITGQIIPAEGFPDLESGLMAIWWKELLFSGIYLFGGICMLFFSLKRKKPLVSVIAGIAYLLIGWILSTKGAKTSYVIFGLAFILFVIGIFKLIRRQIKMAQTRS